MTRKERGRYLILLVCIILIGLISREFSFIPSYFGDALYAMMIYILCSIFFINLRLRSITVLSFIICSTIEFSQLIKWYPLEWIRSYKLGKLVLGNGFDYWDLLAYTIGVLLIAYLDKQIFYKAKTPE